MRREYYEAVKDGMAYDYIANNYWNMSNVELKECCLEALFQVMDDPDAVARMIEEIEDRYEEVAE